MALLNPLVYKDNAHRPLDPATDKIGPTALSLSAVSGNVLSAQADGLYVGAYPSAASVVYVATAGVNAAGRGTRAAPLQTIDYAMANVVAKSLQFPGTAFTIALQAGDSFTLTGRYSIPSSSSLVITFFGDAVYGDFDSPAINGTVNPSLMATLNRPVINQVVTQVNGRYVSNGFDSGNLRLEGVQVNLAANPSGSPAQDAFGMMDFHFAVFSPDTILDLVGTIVNRTDQNSVGGIFGVGGRGNGFLRQYGSQFRIQGAIADASAGMSATQLASRVHFVHMYRDYSNTDTRMYTNAVFPSSATSSNGTGLTKLTWSDALSGTLPQGATLASFPALADAQFGFRNYVTGLVRDQQSRPLNILSSRLF